MNIRIDKLSQNQFGAVRFCFLTLRTLVLRPNKITILYNVTLRLRTEIVEINNKDDCKVIAFAYIKTLLACSNSIFFGMTDPISLSIKEV